MATTSNSSRIGSSSPSASVICEEVFDETCQPSADEINDYADILGIDPVKESHLLYLAKEGLMQALPSDWKICYSEDKAAHYYFNLKTKVSQWDHPLDAVYRELVEQARQKHQSGVATPIIDNSDDASQLDSGIRSLQGNEDIDSNNTNEMSSPLNNNAGNNTVAKAVPGGGNGGCGANGNNGSGGNSSGPTSCSSSTSGFSGGVSRFLEQRSKGFGFAAGATFQSVKASRFEVTKTNPQIGLSMKFHQDTNNGSSNGQKVVFPLKCEQESPDQKKGFVLSGTGAMFLKSKKQFDNGPSQTSPFPPVTTTTGPTSNLFAETSTTLAAVKGILRDSSLTDMRRKFEKEDLEVAAIGEDKKSVRFNLENLKCIRANNSPEDDPSSSRRLTQSPDISVNSDDDDDDDNEDPWDDNIDDDVVEEEDNFSYGEELFANDDNKYVKEVKVITVPKAQTIQMLKAQSLSMDAPDLGDRENIKLTEMGRSFSVESHAAPASAVSFLDKLKDNSTSNSIKPLYEDTDSDSKASSVRSFVQKSEQESASTAAGTNPFDLDELNRKHVREVEQLESKLQAVGNIAGDKLRSLTMATKVISFLKKDLPPCSDQSETVKAQIDRDVGHELDLYRQKKNQDMMAELDKEKDQFELKLQTEIEELKQEHEMKLKNIKHEYDLRLTSHQHQLEEDFDAQIEECRTQLEEEWDIKRKVIVDEHKLRMNTLQKNHSEILQDLERDLKSEEEIVKKEHATKLSEMRDKLTHELEVERQRMRDSGDDRMYEKARCEKRLLEDKYRCLKEKYVRLKTDVRLSLERRNRRREQQATAQQQSLQTTTTGSETERSISQKPSIGNSENRSLTLSTSHPDRSGTAKPTKPPVPPKTHLTAIKDSSHQHNQHSSSRGEKSVERQQQNRKPGIASKYIKHLQVQDDTTSISQSNTDTTISNNYSKGRYLPALNPAAASDNGNSDSEAFQNNQENNNNSRTNQQRKKLFSRMKSASTSRLNSEHYKGDRPCTPVENLRHQLQKLEDLEDQFPDNTLDATYHLRYPFSDISNDHAGTSSELEFFKHRIHLERDSVRRAKESLRTQRTNFRIRQREIKQRHKATITRHSLDQLIQEEKELTEMEVNLHRTRALLGEKVIRLRHLEQSLSRVYEKDKPMDFLTVENKDDATLSDLSSHSSSGFSSTDFASGADTQNLNRRKDTMYHQESTECIQNLEILNAEIREILDVLSKQQIHGGGGMSMLGPSDLSWSHMLTSAAVASGSHHAHHPVSPIAAAATLMHTPQSIPTLADRLETYRQLAAGRMQTSMGGAILAANTIVSQSPRAVNYTTSLVERTRDLRNWLRQAKNEHDLLTGNVAHHPTLGVGLPTASVASIASAASAASSTGGSHANL